MIVQANSHRQSANLHDCASSAPLDAGASHDASLSKADELYIAQARLTRSSTFGPATEQQVRQHFERSFGSVARDPARFDALLTESFGANYDRTRAEQLRQKALVGDFSWLPKVRFVSDETLKGANGAYDAASGTVLLNRDKRFDARLMAQTFIEEAGHHIDTLLNRGDAAGDEGEVFRRLLGGEQLSGSELLAIRTENDHGSIVVDGKRVEVEFWSLGDAFDSVKDAVSSGIDRVGRGVDVVLDAAATGASSASDLVRRGGRALAGAVVNGYSALAELGFSAWEGVNTLVRKSWDGASSLFFRAQHWISKGQHLAHDWMSQGLDSTQRLFGEARRAIGNEAQRWGSAAKNFALGIKDAWVGFAKNFMEAGMRLSHSLALVSGGEFSAAGVELGKGILCIPQAYVDLGLMAGGKAISAAQTVMHLEPVGRPLTDAEITYLRQTFGESIDYSSIEVKVGNAGLLTVSGRPFVLGNTIYMPDENFTPAELAHEATHVWQHQHSGTDYLSEALVARYITGTETSGYAWWDSVPGTPFSQLNPEKQGEFIEAAVRFNAFATTPPAFSHKPAAYQGSLADLNAYLQASVKEIRNVSSIT